MSVDDEPDAPLSDADLHDLGVRLLLGVLKSADTDDIAPKDWWRRAEAALKAGAGMSTSFPQMTSKMADKLEIESPNKWTSRILNSICSDLDAHDQYNRFRTLCERDAFMMVADARVAREMEREEYDGDEFDEAFDEQADGVFDLGEPMDLPDEE